MLKSFKGDSFMIIYDKNGSNMEVQMLKKMSKLDEFLVLRITLKIKSPQNHAVLNVLVHPAGLEPATC